MNKPWFDPDTGDLLLDDYVAERPSYRQVLADGEVTDDELEAQEQVVVALLRQLDGAINPEARDIATEALCELAVFVELQLKRVAISA